MQDQPKMIPQRGSDFYADHRGARPQIVNTVARGQLQEDSYFYTGVIQGANGYREEQNMCRFPSPWKCSNVARNALMFIARPATRVSATASAKLWSAATNPPATCTIRYAERSLSRIISTS